MEQAELEELVALPWGKDETEPVPTSADRAVMVPC